MVTPGEEALREAVAQAWEAQGAWEAQHAAAGGVPYTWETRQRAVCHRVCLTLGVPWPPELRNFPPEVEAAVREGAPAWLS